MHPEELRKMSAEKKLNRATAGFCEGYVQANLLVVPKKYADDFEVFCSRNPKPCTLLEKIGPGDHYSQHIAKRANILNTLPKCLIWESGEVMAEVEEITDFYRSDLVLSPMKLLIS